MPEFQGFNFAQVGLEAFQQARKLKESQRQFDLEQGRLERQESLANLIRMKDLEISQENMQTSRMNAITNRAEAKGRIGTDYNVVDKNKFMPSIGATMARPSNSIVIDELYPDQVLIPKEKVPNVENRYERTFTKDINGKPMEVGIVKGTGEQEVLGESYVKPNDNSLTDYMRWQTRKDDLAKQEALTLKKQAIYNEVMNSRSSLEVDDNGKDIPGTAKYRVKIGGKTRETNNEEELRQLAINEAEKTGLPGKINQWGRVREGDVVNTYDQPDYEKKTGKSNNTKIMTRSEFITDFIKEEERSPTEKELILFKQQGLWK